MFGKKHEEGFNGKTPKWFKDWHMAHFKSVKDRSLRNERWLYIIIVAVIGSGVLANDNVEGLGQLIRLLLGG